jgi:hypothetical protein
MMIGSVARSTVIRGKEESGQKANVLELYLCYLPKGRTSDAFNIVIIGGFL